MVGKLFFGHPLVYHGSSSAFLEINKSFINAVTRFSAVIHVNVAFNYMRDTSPNEFCSFAVILNLSLNYKILKLISCLYRARYNQQNYLLNS